MRKFRLCMVVALLCTCLTTIAQTFTATGKVTDDKGSPINGASIREKSSQRGMTANVSGTFSLSVKQGATLIISAVGFETKEVPAGSNITVSLNPDIKGLSEVVVTGVGVATSKRKVAISVETISAEKLPPAPTASVDQALVGKIPGAQISSIDGTPGARANILLRGINTIQRGTQPLILLDGIQVAATDINSLDLSNVERIEVVQGAASATIYGAQGANGVIQLFTKRGKQGQLNIDYSSNYSLGTLINRGNVHKAMVHGFATDASNNVITSSGTVAEIQSDGTYYNQIVWPRTITGGTTLVNKPYDHNLKYYDHFKQIFQTAPTFNNSLNINGASGKIDFGFSLANSNQVSVIRKNGSVNRSNLSANIGVELFKGFRIRSTTQLIYTKNTLNPNYGTGRNSIYEMLNVSPFYDFDRLNSDGNYAYYLSTGAVSVNGYNPNYYFQYVSGKDNKIDVIQNFQATYSINRFVELDAKYGINYRTQTINRIYKNQSGNISSNSTGDFASTYAADNTGEVDNFINTSIFQNGLYTANIKTDFQRDFGLKIPITTSTIATFDYRKSSDKEYWSYGAGLPSYAIYNVQQTRESHVTRDFVTPFVTYGYLVNQKIDWGEIGGVSGGFRSDYSSAFGQGSKPFTFPRGAGYLRISQLPFWGGLSRTMPEFKIRAAYGAAGIQPLPFDRYNTLSTTNYGNSLAFYFPSSLSNPNLNVEVSKEKEIGTDMSFRPLKGNWLSTIDFSFTYWKRKGENIIYKVDNAPSSGSSTILNNAFSLGSNGYQFSFNTIILKTRDLTWDFTANFSHQTSKILSVSTNQDIVLTASAGSTNLVLKAGDKIGQIYGFKALRSLDDTRQNGTPYIAKADQGKYAISSDGYVVDTATKRILFTNETYAFGDPNPKFNMSFISSVGYKGYLSLSFQFDWVHGSHLYNQTKEWMYRDGIHGDYANPVTIQGVTAPFAAYYQSAYSDFFGSVNGARNSTKDYFYEDASFVRLRNVALAFDVARMLQMKTFKRLQLVLSGRNLLTWTRYTGFDPEISSGTTNSAYERGIDHNSSPNIRSYQIGLNVGF